MRTIYWTTTHGRRVKQSVEETDAGLRVIGSPEVVEPAKPLPPPDPVAVAEAQARADERGIGWLLHGAEGTLRWWLGIDRAAQDVAARRLAVCRSCPEYGDGVKCRKCGCPFRRKVTDAREVCPLGKW